MSAQSVIKHCHSSVKGVPVELSTKLGGYGHTTPASDTAYSKTYHQHPLSAILGRGLRILKTRTYQCHDDQVIVEEDLGARYLATVKTQGN